MSNLTENGSSCTKVTISEKKSDLSNVAEILHARVPDISLSLVALIADTNHFQINPNRVSDDLDTQFLNENKLNSKFTRSLIEEGLITEDISMWKKLHEIYDSNKRTLPKNIFDKIRLEILLSAFLITESDSDSTLLNRYRDLVDKVSSIGFASRLSLEEKFIKGIVCKRWRWDGTDGKGQLYRNLPEGIAYEIGGETNEKGEFKYLTVEDLRKTEVSKSWEPPIRYAEMDNYNPTPEDLKSVEDQEE